MTKTKRSAANGAQCDVIDKFHTSPSESSMAAVVEHAASGEMTNEEIARLALILGRSGEVTSFRSALRSADLASTGGPSSLSTLLGPLYLCAMGCCVPKLGVPGRPAGGVDTLTQIPGYNIFLTSGDVLDCMERCGYAHFLATEDHAPLDAQLFSYRQSIGAQNVPELAIASILAKKVSVGLKRSGLDIRVAPHGNFGRNWHEARSNSQRFRDVSSILEIDAVCILTDATVPYQPFLGRGESLLALHHVFSNSADAYLVRHATSCLAMATSVATPSATTLTSSIQECSKHFFNNVYAQGGSREAFEEYTTYVESNHRFHLIAKRQGFVQIDLERLRDVVVHYQRTGLTEERAFPDEMGVVLKRQPGDFVHRGDLLATVRISEKHWPSGKSRLNEAITVTSKVTLAQGYEEVNDG